MQPIKGHHAKVNQQMRSAAFRACLQVVSTATINNNVIYVHMYKL